MVEDRVSHHSVGPQSSHAALDEIGMMTRLRSSCLALLYLGAGPKGLWVTMYELYLFWCGGEKSGEKRVFGLYPRVREI